MNSRVAMAAWWVCGFLPLLLLAVAADGDSEQLIRLPTENGHAPAPAPGPAASPVEEEVTKWAVLVAGSSGYENYRHQADVCHAYQILKKGGLKDENIVVFMYDDIANSPENPRRGVVINHPKGKDVYHGVPKDYTGEQVTAKNLYAVLLGNKTAVTGGSRKVINSKPNDHIFIYYTDHGGAGALGMPNVPFVYAGDFIKVLRQKHASKSYSKMIIYVEACESGSIFEGLMPRDHNIYVTTAANAEESSWAAYCPGMEVPPPSEYKTCLGDAYSVSWMEDSETHNLKKETIKQQYEVVKARTAPRNESSIGSHVMELLRPSLKGAINQRDADILFMWKKYEQLNGGSEEKQRALREIKETVLHRKHLDSSIDFIGKLVFGFEKGPSVLDASRGSGQPLVDDWDCLKMMVRVFESQCGSLTQYGMKHMRAFANICNNGVSEAQMKEASISACDDYNMGKWSPLVRGHSA
ncbi:unnamed protein product [Triticum turgidum subsp. durum]|uniref:Legumain prodomain domain-containing protein n=1 Tax=Triticum turgidum subsp. durum TaxID=4567 RepID=A0A9R1RQ59_TRITD|nr:unnamed protein product [Triticum turgidum subsp. durum]